MTTTADQRTAQQPRDLSRARRTVAVAVVLGAVTVAGGYPFLGAIAVAIGALFALSFIPWRLTSYGRPADPWPLVIPYLITVMLFLIQVCEEYLSQVWNAFSRIGQPMSERTFIVAAATIVPIFWLLGLVLLCLRTEIGNWMAWVFAIAMGIVELSHLVFPFVDTGHFGYFSGLYTALLLVPAGWYLAFRICRASLGKARSKRAFLWLLGHTVNPLAVRAARSGRGFALLRHVGRKTGRTYETPLILAPVGDGFVAELTYGTEVAWYRNVVAAGHCVVVFKGVEYEIDGMEPYPADMGRRAFGFPGTLILRLLRRQEFRFLPIAKDQPDPQRPAESG
jgi:deazaflavin-dependent oxidoreductase (nitroreductase family)